MEKLRINIPPEMANYIEALDYEVRALRDLLCDAAARGITGADAYADWKQEYLKKSAELCVAKAEVEREFVVPRAEGKKVFWHLDYATQVLTIEEAAQ